MAQIVPDPEDMREARALLLETAVAMFLEDGLSLQEAHAQARMLMESQPLIEFPEFDFEDDATPRSGEETPCDDQSGGSEHSCR